MSNEKHTPGPWEITEHDGKFLLTKDVPVMIGDPIPVGVAYTKADAHLIAAAPDMLAALKEIERQRLGTDQGTLRVRSDRMWEIATAAIAKAEGR